MEPRDSCLVCWRLPDYLTDEILAWLPLQSLCRFRCVCKDWNALILSSKFITTLWADKPPNRNPCLVLQWQFVNDYELKMPNPLVYCFFTRTWKKPSSMSLSFILEQDLKPTYPVTCYGSAAGLCLVRCPRPYAIRVCNPLTRTSLILPRLSSIRFVDIMGIVGGEGDNRDEYMVVMVGTSKILDKHTVEIYNSMEKSWRIVGHLPQKVTIAGTGPKRQMDMVFCDGSFYSLAVINREWGIICFSIRDGTYVSALLPEVAVAKCMSLYLFACGSRVLVAGGIVKDEEKLLQEFIIWEFDRAKVDSSSFSSSWWTEITRMPPSMCEGVNRIARMPPALCEGDNRDLMDRPFMCCVVGDCACFIVYRSKLVIEVVVYSISQKTWSWLPSCPLEDNADDIWAGSVMAFEPRPDMKVQ